jgi:hypothetical protein
MPAPAGNSIVDDDGIPDLGAVVRWEKGDGTASGHLALLGLRTVILSLVMVLGRVIQDGAVSPMCLDIVEINVDHTDHLHALLRRLDLHNDTVLPFTAPDAYTKQSPPLTLDGFLDLLTKQGYLVKTKLPNPGGVDQLPSYDWQWGYREAEFSEQAAFKFIQHV